ncbi:cell envelope integrity protein TolA [Ruegeria atlantica]|uniref:cell envelope integrity protein TolA n=1 Tax=Ruegeria atlantica TaxID=81569 RepID=UPI00147CE167|nr:energy transducer TonB [Ruegeria atlantica]
MKRWVEAFVFVALAAALHLAAFASQPKSGVVAGGVGGADLATIKAAAPSVAEMVKTWEAAPITPTRQTPTVQVPQTPAVPAGPILKIDQAPMAQMTIALAPPEPEKLPQVDTALPPPVVAPTERAERESQQPDKTPAQDGRKAKVTAAGVNKQVAAGSGDGSQAGAGSAEVNAGSSGKQAKLKVFWGAKVRARIERNKQSLRRTDGGSATITLTVSRDGRLLSHKLLKSSGNSALDQAALSAVARTKRVPKAPKGLQGDSFRFSVPIRFEPR